VFVCVCVLVCLFYATGGRGDSARGGGAFKESTIDRL